MDHTLIMHDEERIKLRNIMVWFSNEDQLLYCLLFKKTQCDQEEIMTNTTNRSSNPE